MPALVVCSSVEVNQTPFTPVREPEAGNAIKARLEHQSSHVVEAVELADLDRERRETQIVPRNFIANAFVQTIWTAYSCHYPLVLSPDDVWLVIIQGFAQHVNANSENLRSKLVLHAQGKKKITVLGDKWEIRVGDPQNNWKGVVGDFEEKLAELTQGETAQTLTAPFSTTGEVETMAMRVALMDTLQSYFTYRVMLLCGIPTVELLGTPEDWHGLRARASKLREFDLDWWLDVLDPVLEMMEQTSELCAGANGGRDKAQREALGRVWGRVCHKISHGSGPAYMCGWINVLFPYTHTNESRRNEFVAKKDMLLSLTDPRDEYTPSEESLITEMNNFPAGLSTAPFVLDNNGQIIPMKLVSGFFAVVQDAGTLALRPRVGWCAVRL